VGINRKGGGGGKKGFQNPIIGGLTLGFGPRDWIKAKNLGILAKRVKPL